MNNFAAVSAPKNHTKPSPRLDGQSLVRVDANLLPTQATTPPGVLASSANWDTDFRKKIGIERWGWGLND
jgi:hypothetical protein